MSLYNLRLLAPNKYAMAKFDADFNVEAVYNLEPKGSGYTCDCPANARSVVLKPCKHKRMIPLMLGAVNTDRFYDPETRSWCQPLGQPSEEFTDFPVPPLEAEGRQGSEQVQEPEPPLATPEQAKAMGLETMTEEELLKGLEPLLPATLVALKPAAAPTIRRR